MTVAVPVGVGDLGVGVDELRQRAEGLGDVLVVLDDDAHGVREDLRVQLVDAEHGQRARPVDGLGDARRLAQLELAQAADDLDELAGGGLGQPGVLGAHDLQLALRGGVVQEQVQAAALEGGGQVTRVVAGQDDVRGVLGDERADLRHRDLELAEGLEQHRLERLVGAVDLVDQQHDGLVGADGLEQRALGEEVLGEEHAVLVLDLLHRRRDVGGVLRRSRRSSRGASGCRGAACRSPTRRGPWSRPGPRSTADAGTAGRWRRRASWRARSCPRRRGPRAAAASRGGSAGTPSWPGAGRRCSRARRARRRPRRPSRRGTRSGRSGCSRSASSRVGRRGTAPSSSVCPGRHAGARQG